MKRIFILDCGNEVEAREFMLEVRQTIYNTSYFSYYNNILGSVISAMNINNIDTNSYYKALNHIEHLWIKLDKARLYEKVLDAVNNRDSDRALIFILANNKHIVTLLKRHFTKKEYGHVVVRTVKLETNMPKQFVTTGIPSIAKHDVKIVIPNIEVKSLRSRLITRFILQHIPVKNIQWVKLKNDEVTI